MKRLIFLLLLSGILFAQTTVPYRVRMAASSYSAQLLGNPADAKTNGITVQGVYNITLLRHEFAVLKDGRYDLWFDAAGGSHYVKDEQWSGANGREIKTGYFQAKSDTSGNYVVDQLDDNTVTTDDIINDNVTLEKLSPTVRAQMGGNHISKHAPDDDTIDLKIVGVDTTIRVKPSYNTQLHTDMSDSLYKVNGLSSLKGIKKVGIYQHALNNRIFNPVDYGADTTGALESTLAFNEARDSADVKGGEMKIPDGIFLLSNYDHPVRINFVGSGWGTQLKGKAGANYVIKITGTSHDNKQKVGDFIISGTATAGIVISTPSNLKVENVHFAWGSGPFDYGFHFDQGWGNNIDNLSTHGATIDTACFFIEGPFNCNSCSNWYTSNFNPHGILFEGKTATISYANTFTNMTMQANTVGVELRDNCYGFTFNSLYTENVVLPLRLGLASGNQVRGISINGGALGPPLSTHPNYANRTACIEAGNINGLTIDGMNFAGCDGTPTLYAMRLTDAYRVVLNGCYLGSGTTSDIQDYIVKSSTASVGSGIMSIQNGFGSTYESQIIMQTDGWGNKHQILQVRQNTGVMVKDGNRIGAVTLSSGSGTVSFGTAETNTSYNIFLTGSLNETFYWGSRTVNGFTVTSSNGSSAATVFWQIVRDEPEWVFESWTPATADTCYY